MDEPIRSKTPRSRRQAALVAAPVAAFVAWLAFWLWQTGPIRTPPMPAVEDQQALLALAREAFVTPGVAPRMPEVVARHGETGAIVTAYFPGTTAPPVSAWADIQGGDAASAVATAAAKAGRTWESRNRAGAGSERIRVDLTGRERRVFAASKRKTGRTWFLWRLVPIVEDVMDPGVDGLVVRHGEELWFSGPSERVERSRNAMQLVETVRREASGRGSLRRFRAASFIEPPPPATGAAPLTIVRGNVLPPYPATAAALREASALGGQYLARAIDENGRFLYQFDAQEARTEGGYNLLRHAGTLWSMFQIYGDNGDPAVRAAAERGLANLSREYVWLDPRVPGAVFLREGPEGRPKTGDVKLGACGLGILAYTEAEKNGVPLSEADQAIMIGLGKGILAMQKPNGELASYYSTPDRRANPRRSVYYPGEAILGLMELYDRDQDRVWLDAAMRAADFQIFERWKVAGIEVQVPPDAWLTQALEKLWLATKEERYKRYAFRLGDELIAQTFPPGANVPPDLRGASFTMEKTVRVTPTSSRNEAVVAAARLARAAGDVSREKKYLEAARAAAWFGIAQQYRAENVHFVVKPELALGGIREAVNDNSVRIDGVQHAVSGFLGLAEMLSPKPLVTDTAGGPS